MSSVGTIRLGLSLDKTGLKQLTGMNGQSLNNMGAGAKNLTGNLNGANKSAGGLLGTFKGLALAAGAAFSVAAIVSWGSKAIDTAKAVQAAYVGLQSTLNNQGRSFSRARTWINEYVSDGLVPLNEAVTAYKNLSLRGYSDKQIQDTLTALKDSAAFGRQSSYTLGEAVRSASEGLKNENSILVDNAGVTKNVAKMWDDYAKSIGKTAQQLTRAEKIEAEYQGIMQETKFQTGDAAKYVDTYGGKLAGLSFAFFNLRTNIGAMLMTALTPFIGGLINAVNWVNSLVTSFMSLLTLLTGANFSLFDTSENLSNFASGASDVSSGLDGVGSSAGGAGSAAKKAMRALMGFDSLNVMPEKDAGSGGGGGGGGVSAAEVKPIADPFSDISSGAEELVGKLSGVYGYIQRLKELFLTGFKLGGGGDLEASFGRIQEHISGILGSLNEIANDPEVAGAAERLVNAYVYNVGVALGSFISIGTSIAENITGGIDYYLQDNKDWLKKRVASILTNWAELIDVTGDVSIFVARIAESLRSEGAKELTAAIGGMFSNAFIGALDSISTTSADVIGAIAKPFTDNDSKIKKALEKWFEIAATIWNPVAENVSKTSDALKGFWDNYMAPFLNNASEAFSDALGSWLDTWNNVVAPGLNDLLSGKVFEDISRSIKKALDGTGTWFSNKFKEARKGITDAFKDIGEWFSARWTDVSNAFMGVGIWFKTKFNEAWTGITSIFTGIGFWFAAKWQEVTNALASVGSWFKTTFTTAWNNITSIFSGIGQWFTSRWNDVTKAFGSAASWFSNIFSNAWSNIKNAFSNVGGFFQGVWNTIVNIFSGLGSTIGNGIAGGVRSAINGALSTVQSAINNGISIINSAIGVIKRIPGTGWLPYVPSVYLPRLAQGGFVEANTPRLAIVGDNKREGEIIAPESKIAEAVAVGLAKVLGAQSTLAGAGAMEINIPVYLDSQQIGKAYKRYDSLETLRSGGRSGDH